MEPPKLRLMCSYGGNIIPRPNSKSLSYVGGDTRIVAVDRRTTASSFAAFSSHLSRVLFNKGRFQVKYHLPNDDLDALISVVNDEDLANMIDEHDRLSPPNRIRLFLFPVKTESLGAMMDPKSESWFCDALKGTRIMQSADSGRVVMAMRPETEGHKLGGTGAESFVMETSSSFGSSGSSSLSLSNSVGVVASEHCSGGLSLLDRKMRVPSSASLESDNSAGGACFSPRTGMFQEPLIQVSSVVPLLNIKLEGIPVHSTGFQTQNEADVLGYPSTHQTVGKQHLLVSSGATTMYNKSVKCPPDHSMYIPSQNTVPILGYPLTQQQDGYQQPQVSPEASSIINKPENLPDHSLRVPTQNAVPILEYPLPQQQDGKQQPQVSPEAPPIINEPENLPPDHSLRVPTQSAVPIEYPLTQQQDGTQQPQVSPEAPPIINKSENSPPDCPIRMPTQNTVPVLECPFNQQQDGKQPPQVSPEAPPIITKAEKSPPHHSLCIPTQNSVPVLGYPLTHQLDGKQQPQVSPEAMLVHNKSESSPDYSINIPTQNTVHALMYPSTQQPDGNQQLQVSPEAPLNQTDFHVLGYPLTLQTDGKQQLQHEPQLIQGGLHYLPQYPNTQMPISPYYPVYQMPMHQQPIHCQQNQPYPIYLVPVRPSQYHNMPMQCNFVDVNNTSSMSRPPLHPRTAAYGHHIAHKDIFGAQPVAESASNVCVSGTPLVSMSSCQAQLVTEPLNHSKPVTPDSLASMTQISEFDDDVAYSQVYKSQPSAPVLPSQTVSGGIPVVLVESQVQVQPHHATEQAALHPLS